VLEKHYAMTVASLGGPPRVTTSRGWHPTKFVCGWI